MNSTDKFGSTPLDGALAENLVVYQQGKAYVDKFLRIRGGNKGIA